MSITPPLQQGATYINGNYFPSSTGLDFGMSVGDRGRAAMYATSGGGFSRKPTADRMTLVSSRNQRAQNVVSSVGEGDGMAILIAFPDQNPAIPSNQGTAKLVEKTFGDGDGKFKVGHAGIVIIDSKGKTSYFDFGRYTRPDIKRKRGTDEGAVRSSKNFSQLRIPDWNFSKTEEENVTAILTSLHYSTIFKGYGTIMGALAKGLNYQPMLNYARKAESMGYLPFGGYSCGYNLLSCGSYCAKFARGVGDAGGIDWDWDTFTGEANIEDIADDYDFKIITLPNK